MAQLKEFDDLLQTTVKASRLSGSKVAKLSELSQSLVHEDHHIVTTFYKLNASLSPASQSKISSLYVFDAIARACRTAVNKGTGKSVGKERGKGTQAGMLLKLEGVVDSWVNGMIDDGKGGLWSEGKDKTRKIIDIWAKHGTFPPSCIEELKNKLASTPGSSSTPVDKPLGYGSIQESGLSRGSGSTTPSYPPPAHIAAQYRNRHSDHKAKAPSSSSGIPRPPPSKTEVKPGQPGDLPPEIAKLLGIGQGVSPSGTAAQGAGSGFESPNSNSIPADVAAILASVTKSNSHPQPVSSEPSKASTPFPGLAGLIDPNQLAALASIAAKAKNPLPHALPALPAQARPPQHSQSPQRPIRSPDYQRFHAPVQRGMREEIAIPLGQSRQGSGDWHGGGGGMERRDRPGNERGWRNDGRQGQRRRSRSPDRGMRFDRRYEQGQGQGHRPNQPVRQSNGPPFPVPPPPLQVPQETGRAPPPAWMQQPPKDDEEEDMALDDSDGESQLGGGKGRQAETAPPVPSGLPLPPFISPHQDQQPFQTQPSQTFNPQLATPGLINSTALTLQSFPIQAFDPTSPESWASLGTAWKNTTGQEPGQIQLMHFLATGQIMDAAGGSMPGMHDMEAPMGSAQTNGMNPPFAQSMPVPQAGEVGHVAQQHGQVSADSGGEQWSNGQWGEQQWGNQHWGGNYGQ